MEINPLTATDFYKTGHCAQYPDGTNLVYSNFTARSAQHAKMPDTFDNKVVFFGLQGFIESYLIEAWNKGFFQRPKREVVRAYKRRMDTSLGPGSVDTKHIEDLHDLGYLPLQIHALPEGSRVNLRVEKAGDDFVLHDRQTYVEAAGGELQTVFHNGHLVVRQSLTEIRERLGALGS